MAFKVSEKTGGVGVAFVKLRGRTLFSMSALVTYCQLLSELEWQ